MPSIALLWAPNGCSGARALALTVSTSPDFAVKWLVSRLGRFAEEHPSIDLRVSATLNHADFAREEDVDLAGRHGGHRPESRIACEHRWLYASVPRSIAGTRAWRPCKLARHLWSFHNVVRVFLYCV